MNKISFTLSLSLSLSASLSTFLSLFLYLVLLFALSSIDKPRIAVCNDRTFIGIPIYSKRRTLTSANKYVLGLW